MKQTVFFFIFLLAVICNSGCHSAEIHDATAKLFDSVLVNPDQDIVMCRQLRCDYNFEEKAIDCMLLIHWFEVVRSVKNFLMPGDILIIHQELTRSNEDIHLSPNNFQETPVLYIDIDRKDGKFFYIELNGEKKYIFRQKARHGDLFNTSRPGNRPKFDRKKAERVFLQSKKDFWERQLPGVNWHKAPRMTPEANKTDTVL